MKRADPVGNVTCYAYDALHRVTAVTYPSGSYASRTPAKYFIYDSATVNGVAMANAKGRLAEAYTGASKTTDLGFSYSARGEVTDVFQKTPNSGGYYRVTNSYWASGLARTLNLNLAGTPSWTYNPDGQGRVASVYATSGQNPVTSASYNVFGLPTSVTFGSGDSDSFGCDANTGRMTSYQAALGISPSVSIAVTGPQSGARQMMVYPFIAHRPMRRLAAAAPRCAGAFFQNELRSNRQQRVFPVADSRRRDMTMRERASVNAESVRAVGSLQRGHT